MAKRGQKSLLNPGLVVFLLLGSVAVCSCNSVDGLREVCNHLKGKLGALCQGNKPFICSVCQDSSSGPIFRPVHEAAANLRAELKTKVDYLKSRVYVFEGVKRNMDQFTNHIQTQFENTEKQIKEQIQHLHLFLQKEKAARISALRAEKERKRQMNENQISSLSKKISTGEKVLASDNAVVLVLQLAGLREKTAESTESIAIDVAKHLGNLKSNVLGKLQEIILYTPVILDPNTANPWLIFSDDLTSARHGEKMQTLPEIPGRYDFYPSVLGSEGFNSGAHCWDVQVGDNNDWIVGVVTESLPRRGRELVEMSGRWAVWHKEGVYGAVSPPQPPTHLTIRQKPQKIRVQLDWYGGSVTFSNPEDNSYIHSFDHRFTERVIPYFSTLASLRVLPVTDATYYKGGCPRRFMYTSG